MRYSYYVMARGFDWSRARMQKLVAERGTTPVDEERPPAEPVLSHRTTSQAWDRKSPNGGD